MFLFCSHEVNVLSSPELYIEDDQMITTVVGTT